MFGCVGARAGIVKEFLGGGPRLHKCFSFLGSRPQRMIRLSPAGVV
jgi:hypothetical protein